MRTVSYFKFVESVRFPKRNSIILAIGLLAAVCTPSHAQHWNAWTVHNGNIDLSQSGEVHVEIGTSGAHYWNKSGTRGGQKAYVSTDFFNGQTIGQITTLDWDTALGSTGDSYLNIYVQNAANGNAILTFTNSVQWGSNPSTSLAYGLVEEEGDWSGFSLGHNSNTFDAVSDLTIVGNWLPPEGPDSLDGEVFQDITINGGQPQGNALFGDDHWAQWAGPGVDDGFLWVFGQSTQPSPQTVTNGISILNVDLAFDPDGAGSNPAVSLDGLNTNSNTTVVPEPSVTTLLLLGLGGLMTVRRSPRSAKV